MGLMARIKAWWRQQNVVDNLECRVDGLQGRLLHTEAALERARETICELNCGRNVAGVYIAVVRIDGGRRSQLIRLTESDCKLLYRCLAGLLRLDKISPVEKEPSG